jgi:hypothetical protein
VNRVVIVWDDFLDLPVSGPLDVSLIPLQTFGDSTATWANAVIELSFQTPPPPPTLNADLGIVASPFSPLSIVTSGDFDTELAVYSSTGAVIRRNDDAPGAVVHSETDFDFGLPSGDYVAVLGGFNTTFGDNYVITAGTAAGDYGLNVAGNPVDGTLAVEQLAYVGFSVGGPTADFNGDGEVDGDDFLAWQANFGTMMDATKEQGDYDNDGDVDGNDFLGWQTELGSGSGSASAAVPEPGSWLLVAVGLALCLTKRRGSHFVHAA